MSTRRAFTAIELMVVISVMVILVGLSIPGLMGAMRKGAVSDAANSIMRAASQARQLARTRAAVVGKAYGIVVVKADRSYVAVTFGNIPNAGSSPAVTDIVLRPDGKPLIEYPFNRNVYLPTDVPVLAYHSETMKPAYSGNIGCVFETRTGYPVAMFPPDPNPRKIDVLGMQLRTLDQRYTTALDIYRIGLLNAQDIP